MQRINGCKYHNVYRFMFIISSVKFVFMEINVFLCSEFAK